MSGERSITYTSPVWMRYTTGQSQFGYTSWLLYCLLWHACSFYVLLNCYLLVLVESAVESTGLMRVFAYSPALISYYPLLHLVFLFCMVDFLVLNLGTSIIYPNRFSMPFFFLPVNCCIFPYLCPFRRSREFSGRRCDCYHWWGSLVWFLSFVWFGIFVKIQWTIGSLSVWHYLFHFFFSFLVAAFGGECWVWWERPGYKLRGGFYLLSDAIDSGLYAI